MFAIVPGMAAQRRNARTRRNQPPTPQDREQAERDARLGIHRLQDSAYANLRSAAANVAVFVGFAGVFMLVIGAADGGNSSPGHQVP